MSAVIRWEDPPPRAGCRTYYPRAHDWPAIVEDLQAKPHTWAVVAISINPSASGQTANYIRNGHLAAFRDGRYESTARKVGDECRVYARYIGEA